MATPDPLAVVQRAYEAFKAGDGATLLSLAAPASTWMLHGPKSHPFAGSYAGPQGLGKFLGAIAAAVDIRGFHVDEMHACGDEVFAVGREEGRWKPSGGDYVVTWAHRFRVRDGRVTRFDEWYDTASMLAARKPKS